MKDLKNYQFSMLVLFLCVVLFTASCKKAIYVPATGDTIYLEVETLRIEPGQNVTITVTGVKANGHPVPKNTLIHLIADSGQFVDREGKKVEGVLLTGGKGQVTYHPDTGFTGEAITISARCGAATITPEQLVIDVHRQEVRDIARLFLTAFPRKLPVGGGTTEITVTAFDVQQEVVPGKKIVLETTVGALTPSSPIITDNVGKVTARLMTDEPTEVTAIYKEISETISIDVGKESKNKSPAASFVYSPMNPVSGETVYFTSTSTDSDGTIVSYRWNFGDGTTSTRANPVHVYPISPEAKEYPVVLTVIDDGGKRSSTAQTITISVVGNQPPAAAFSFSPASPGTGEIVQFDASASSDLDGTIVQYDWTFGDGSTGTGTTPTHAYNPAQTTTYTVTLTVTDNGGKTGTLSQDITVEGPPNQAPVAVFVFSPASPGTGEIVQFDASASSDLDGTIVQYDWTFGDGSTGTGTTPAHAYNPAQTTTYTVTLTVTDNGGKTGTLSQDITVEGPPNQAPVAVFVFSPASPGTGEIVQFDASASSDLDGTIVQYDWTFGDGSTGTGTTPTHAYNPVVPTIYTVTLTVTDNEGATDSISRSVTVTAPPPVAYFDAGRTTITAGDTVDFTDLSTNNPTSWSPPYPRATKEI